MAITPVTNSSGRFSQLERTNNSWHENPRNHNLDIERYSVSKFLIVRCSQFSSSYQINSVHFFDSILFSFFVRSFAFLSENSASFFRFISWRRQLYGYMILGALLLDNLTKNSSFLSCMKLLKFGK